MDKCSSCGSDLDRGHVTYYRDNIAVDMQCFDCDKEKKFKQYAQDKVVSTSLMMDSNMIASDIKYGHPLKKGEFAFAKHALEINEGYDKLRELTKRFEKEVWFGGLQELLAQETTRGVSAKLDDLSVLTYCICGRCMITFESKTSSITVMVAEKTQESTMGVHGLCGTIEQTSGLIVQAIQAWRQGMLSFAPDKEVHIAGF